MGILDHELQVYNSVVICYCVLVHGAFLVMLEDHFSVFLSEFWYVLLDTIRITDVAFSPDGNMVVVSCWDTSVHLFVKVLEQL